ncbi:MAG: hypothetical protein IIZ48_06505 [Erysipelotrichales bacterium]|nr:hypothetical protein [Erysipelotrichales bacterium]
MKWDCPECGQKDIETRYCPECGRENPDFIPEEKTDPPMNSRFGNTLPFYDVAPPEYAAVLARTRLNVYFLTENRLSECTCVACGKTFDPAEIKDWTDQGATAVCPYCAKAAIAYEDRALTLTPELLKEAKEHLH